ncbi:HNH endonuclease [Cronobacter phage vB_CsaM_GAP32]|uniref:HNH endonuclease n=1 Tax=Cronobacter phage vB_CsaM_GAP32 TaxID=1141136 RepID=K4FB69_9CAUD|nr:HNH endonuclease [Cronobacter phage vB_CsaM_GAP32]AFC21824.1 HNH endonuclease [Cronobacter phage vB_CsaM_GAP32]
MKELLYKLYKEKGSALSKSDIDNCNELPSYNTLNSKGLKLVELNREFKEKLYDEKPKYCSSCNNKIEFCRDINVKKFCSQSCAASYNNSVTIKRQRKITAKICKCCNKEFKLGKHISQIFCGEKCGIDFQYNENIKSWLSSEHPGWTGKTRQLSKFVRRYLHETRGTACEECGWDERHPIDGAVLTEIEHIDGNAENNAPTNLKILCPNCHSMTPTFRARNKQSKRIRK